MPMVGEAVTKKLWKANKIIKETCLLLDRVNKGSLIKMTQQQEMHHRWNGKNKKGK